MLCLTEYATFTLTVVALANKLFFNRFLYVWKVVYICDRLFKLRKSFFVYAVCPISLKHKRQTTCHNANATK